MGLQEMKKLRHHDIDQGGRTEKAVSWVLAGEITLPPLRPVKVGRRRHGGGGGLEEEEETVTTPRGEGCRIPAEAATCPPAPKKPRTAAVSIVADRRCNCDDGEAFEFFRVPADLESVFFRRAAKAN